VTTAGLCHAPGCEAALAPQTGRGRRRIYCSPRCRARAVAAGGRLTVEVDHEPVDEDAWRPAGRVWFVRLRRGRRAVVVATELGRPTADHLASQIADVISPRRREDGAAME
jgi:hypothetical protein